MKFLKWLFTIIGTMLLGMFGGQKNKGTRRFGIPGLALLMSFLSKKFKLKHLTFILLIPILFMGYGENSWLMSLLHSDVLVRIAYGVCLSLPFLAFGARRWLCALICLIVGYSVRAGSLGQFWGMDILIEDMVRYGILGGLIAFNIFVD